MTSNSKRILIVDDEEDLTWSIARSLRKESEQLEIICVNSGEEALEVLKRFNLDLIISDIRMPGMDGFELLDYVKKTHPSLQVIIMTAWDENEVKKMIDLQSGIFYIEKPFDITKLKQIIYQAVTKSSDKYKGRFIDLNLKNVININCQNKFNGFLNITNGKEIGEIHFRSGEIIHAQVGNVEGDNALLNVLNWNDGQYDTVLTDSPVRKTISTSWKTLLKK